MYSIVNEILAQDELEEIVTRISSPDEKVLLLAWACLSCVVLTEFAVPPRAVVFTLNVAVQVPAVDFVVVFTIVPPKGTSIARS